MLVGRIALLLCLLSGVIGCQVKQPIVKPDNLSEQTNSRFDNTIDPESKLPVLSFTDIDEMHQGFLYWSLKKSIRPKPVIGKDKKPVSGCIEVNFTITRVGKAEDIVIVNAYPEGVFDSSVTNAIRNRIWQPTEKNSAAEPIRMVNYFVFNVHYPEFDANCSQYMSFKPLHPELEKVL